MVDKISRLFSEKHFKNSKIFQEENTKPHNRSLSSSLEKKFDKLFSNSCKGSVKTQDEKSRNFSETSSLASNVDSKPNKMPMNSISMFNSSKITEDNIRAGIKLYSNENINPSLFILSLCFKNSLAIIYDVLSAYKSSVDAKTPNLILSSNSLNTGFLFGLNNAKQALFYSLLVSCLLIFEIWFNQTG